MQRHGCHRIATPAAPDKNFRHHDRHTDQNDAKQVDQNECATTVLPGDIRKLPDIAKSDCRASDGQDERKPGRPVAMQGFSFRRVDCIMVLHFIILWPDKMGARASKGAILEEI